jgi:hypothetical protein
MCKQCVRNGLRPLLAEEKQDGDKVCRFLLENGCFAAELRGRVERLACKRRLSTDEVWQNACLLLLEQCRRDPTLRVQLERDDQEVWGFLGRRLTWLVQDAARHCRRQARSVASCSLSEQILTTLAGREEAALVEREENCRWLRGVIDRQLSEAHRQIIELVLENDFDLRHPGPIIDRLRATRNEPDLPYHTVYHMIQRARLALARALERSRQHDYSMCP